MSHLSEPGLDTITKTVNILFKDQSFEYILAKAKKIDTVWMWAAVLIRIPDYLKKCLEGKSPNRVADVQSMLHIPKYLYEIATLAAKKMKYIRGESIWKFIASFLFNPAYISRPYCICQSWHANLHEENHEILIECILRTEDCAFIEESASWINNPESKLLKKISYYGSPETESRSSWEQWQDHVESIQHDREYHEPGHDEG